MSYIQILRDADALTMSIDEMTLPTTDPVYVVVRALLKSCALDLPETSKIWDVTVFETTADQFGQEFWRGVKDHKAVRITILDGANRLEGYEFTYDEINTVEAQVV